MASSILVLATPVQALALHRLLEDQGLIHGLASSAEEAQDRVKAGKWLIFAETELMGDVELASPGQVEVVAMGEPNPEAIRQAIGQGCSDWIDLPATASQLVRAVAMHNTRSGTVEEVMNPADVAATVLHEVNNPLTALMAYLDEARSGLDRQKLGQVREALSACEATLDHLRTVARSGRTMLRRDAGPGNPIAAIQAAVVMAGSKRNPKVTLHVDVGLPPVTMPSHQLAQSVLNLIINASHAGSRTVVISAVCLDDEVIIDVIDDGEGMSTQVLQKVMNRGFTTKKEGSGIGLAALRRMVVGVGGRVDLASQAGTGTQVRIFLPVTATDQ